MKIIEINITAPIHDDEVGHEAIVATKELVAALVQRLESLGLKGVRSKRNLATRREKALEKAAPKMPAVGVPVPKEAV